MMTMLPPPLVGLRVLDFSRMLAGPFCTAILADVGAEVIKIESPNGGDDSRHFAPQAGGQSTYFMLANRGKLSVTLDLKTAAGRRIAQDLARHCDIVVENFKPGVADRLGVDYKTLSTINPRLIYASISGFGQTGPYASRPAYDIIAQAMSGIMSVNGTPDMPPTRVGESIGDIAAGLQATWAILAALHGRDRAGRGQHLDIAMVDSVFTLMITALSQFLFTGNVPKRIGNANPISAPLDSFTAKDGTLIIAVANDAMFVRLAEAIGMPGLTDDVRFSADAARKQNEVALKTIIEGWTLLRTVEEAVATLQAAAVPASPVLSIDAVVRGPQVSARQLIVEVDHPTAGTIPSVTQPVKFLGCGAIPARPAPLLGEHTQAVLRSILGVETLDEPAGTSRYVPL